MRRPLLTAALILLTLPAVAGWNISPDGAARVENGGDSSLSLSCANNANTGNHPSWRVELAAVGLNTLGPQVEMEFRFPGQRPLRLVGDHRLGRIFIDGMNLPSQSDLSTLATRLKAASRVTVSLRDNSSGAMAGDPLTFALKGSARAIGNATRACR